MRTFWLLWVFAIGGCGRDYIVDKTYVYAETPHAVAEPSHSHGQLIASLHPPGYGASVMVLQSRHLDRATEVVGILDIHYPVGDHAAALAELQAEAAAMGADAVVGAEFHHGEGDGEPIHVSGMAVRFIELDPAR